MPLQDLVKAFTRLRTAPPFDLAQFDDPVASRTGWVPAASGGTGFRTRRLVEASPARLELRPTVESLKVAGLIAVMVVAVVLVLLGNVLEALLDLAGVAGALAWPATLVLVVGGVVAAVVAVRKWVLVPLVFDRASGCVWIGEPPMPGAPRTGPDDRIPLASAHALQILAERVPGRKNHSFTSYELNLVQKDGSRINLMDHGDLAALRADAAKLAQFLKCRVWDAVVPAR